MIAPRRQSERGHSRADSSVWVDRVAQLGVFARPRPLLRHRRRHLDLAQHPTLDKSLADPAQRLPPVVIAAPRGLDLLRVGRESDRAAQDVDCFPRGPGLRAAHADSLGADDDGARARAVLVLLHDDRHAVGGSARRSVRGQPGSGQFGDADRHAGLVAEDVGDPGDGGGDHLGVLVGVPGRASRLMTSPPSRWRPSPE
mgnify:CR=1 FL=1